jgi:PKD repeat protein
MRRSSRLQFFIAGFAAVTIALSVHAETVLISQTFTGSTLPQGWTPANAIISIGGGTLSLQGCLHLPGTYSRATGLRIEADVAVSEYFWFSSFYNSPTLCGQTTLTTGYTAGMLVTQPTGIGGFWLYREPAGGNSLILGTSNANIVSGKSYHETVEYRPDGSIRGYLNGTLMFVAQDSTYSQGPLQMSTQGPALITKVVVTKDLNPVVMPPVASFSFSPATPKAGESITFNDMSSNLPTSWLWSFGDGGTSPAQNATHAYVAGGSYTVQLTASNSAGSNSISRIVTVASGAAPVANFTFSPTSPTTGQTVTFTDISTGGPTNWAWDFGDHGTSTDRNPIHTFVSAGAYPVTLTVSNNTAPSSHATKTIQVTAASACSGNCVVISGRVTVRGSDVAITGNGSPSRVVKLIDASGQPTSYSTPISASGTYSITAPAGTYTSFCDVIYVDHVQQPDGTTVPKLRRAYKVERVPGTSGVQQVDFVFPLPIVFLHGIISGPGKWDNWSALLGAGTGRPDAIFFTPFYTDTADYETESLNVVKQLDDDFAVFKGVPPYDVVAHSKGGLVGRVLHGRYIEGKAMTHAVLLGTPNDGSACATDALAHLYYLSRCDLETVNDDADAGTWGAVQVIAIAGTKHLLPAECLSFLASCHFENGPDDGAVPVDSVFKITKTANGGASKTVLPGFVTPYNHCELGSSDTQWLFSSVILPYFDSDTVSVNGHAIHCPSSYSTNAVPCTTTRPSANDYCYDGRGVTSTGFCSLALTVSTYPGILMNWSEPGTGQFQQPPGTPTASYGSFTGCGTPIGSSAVRNTAALPSGLLGFQIYRSSMPIATPDPSLRIGVTGPAVTSFTDPEPEPGMNYYAVTAIYDSGESLVAAAAPIAVGGKRRAVSH